MRTQDPVNRLMTEAVLSVDVGKPISEALRLFAEYPVHHLPVVRDGRLVGMLSSADVMKLEGFLPKNGKQNHDYLDQRISIERLMRRPVISVQPHQSAEDAARLMVTHGIHALPVVNADDRLLGIITTSDMMQSVLNGTPRHDNHAETMDQASLALKPDPATFELALRAAREASLSEKDSDGMAQSLLYLHQRGAALEEVTKLARRYLTAGQDQTLHATLLKAIARAEQLEERARAEPVTTLGLVAS